MDCNSVTAINEAANTITLLGIEMFGNVLIVVLAAVIAYFFGLRTYFKQREHEQIMRRYLDEGIDLVLVGVNQALRVFIDNHQKASETLRQVEKNRKVNIPVMFETFDRHILEVTPYGKTVRLVGNQIFTKVIGAFLGYVDAQSAFLEKEFQQLRYIVTEKGQARTLSPDLTVEEVKEFLDDIYKKVEKYFLLIDELQELTLILEEQTTLSWADLDKFKSHPEVKASVKRLEECFKAEII